MQVGVPQPRHDFGRLLERQAVAVARPRGRYQEATAVQAETEFFNLYNHGFIRVAVGIPEVRVADPEFNAARTVELMEQAAQHQAILVLFPELGLSSYSCEDLFHQQAVLDGAMDALHTVLRA